MTNILFYAIISSIKKIKKGEDMGYKKLGKNMSFAASGSTPSWRGLRPGKESLPLGEGIPSMVHHHHKKHMGFRVQANGIQYITRF